MGYKLLDEQDAKARKYLGDSAKFPERKVDIGELGKKQFEASDAFKEGRDELNKLLQDFENANDAIINALKLLAVTYEKTDFELDPKKKEDAKKIKQAHAQFAAFFAGETTTLKDIDKTIDELSKHLVLLSKYKGPSK